MHPRHLAVPSVEAVSQDLSTGRPVIITDAQSDAHPTAVLACAAALASPTTIAFMVRHTSGFLEVAMPAADCTRLGLSAMSGADLSRDGSAQYTVTVDAIKGVGTGISAADRATTMRALADPHSKPLTFTRPGHVQPLATDHDGVLAHPDYAHAAIELARIAGTPLAISVGHLVSEVLPTEMADLGGAMRFAEVNGLHVVDVSEVIASCAHPNVFVADRKIIAVDTRHGRFTGRSFRLPGDQTEYLVLTTGDRHPTGPTAIHVHHDCLAQSLLADTCLCRIELERAMEAIARCGRGVVIYVRRAASIAACTDPGHTGLEPAIQQLLTQLSVEPLTDVNSIRSPATVSEQSTPLTQAIV